MAYVTSPAIAGVELAAAASTVAAFKTGTRVNADDGTSWIYLSIPVSTAIRQYDTVGVTGTGTAVAALTNTNAATGVTIAIAQTAVASDANNIQYMWFLVANPFANAAYKVRVAASCAVNARLSSTAFGGTLDDTSAGSAVPIHGIVLTDSQPAGSSGSRTFRTAPYGVSWWAVV